jgi:hypothetical protein
MKNLWRGFNEASLKDKLILGGCAVAAVGGVGALFTSQTLIFGGALAYFTGMPLAKSCGIYLAAVGGLYAANLGVIYGAGKYQEHQFQKSQRDFANRYRP